MKRIPFMVRKHREGTCLQHPHFFPCSQGQNNVRMGMLILILCSLIAIILSGCAGTGGDAGEMSGHLLATGSTALQPLVTVAAKMYQQTASKRAHCRKGWRESARTERCHNKQGRCWRLRPLRRPWNISRSEFNRSYCLRDSFCMITNTDVTLPSLSHNDIIRIFSTGDVHNWNDWEGPICP